MLMSELDLIYGPNCCIAESYGKEPFRKLFAKLEGLQDKKVINDMQYQILCKKLLNSCRKLYMTHGAGVSAIKTEEEFMTTQNREFPTLIWEDEIKILYHLEAMVLFARSALDLGAYIFSNLLIKPYGTIRKDSFNDFSKTILKNDDELLDPIKNLLIEMQTLEISWYRLLCGSEKGRALRDKLVHQTIISIDYMKVDDKSDKEYCHVIVNDIPIPLELFMAGICSGVYEIFFLAEDVILKIHDIE